uniref:PSI domain-containing protein n=1 Tax=Timema monikensis TaxID=170555 RepID=A0A7R9E8X0_9NEOP|nr:unnamed protein product [Timema monikensis]
MGAWTWASTSSGLIWSAGDEEISKVKIWHCSSYINCSTCLEAKDPYCGWCSLEKRQAVDLEPVKGIVANPSAFSPSSRHLITPFQAVYQTNKFLNREPEGSFRFET